MARFESILSEEAAVSAQLPDRASKITGVDVMEGSTVCLSELCELVADSVDPATRPDDPYLGLEHLTSGRLVSTRSRASVGRAKFQIFISAR